MDENYQSNHYDGKRFYNLDRGAYVHKTLFDFLKWKFTRHKTPWPKTANIEQPMLAKTIGPHEVVITHINHATELIQLPNLTVLTDPVFSERVSPFTWYGPKRVRQPGLSLQALPQIDVVLISHNHYDHLDIKTLVYLKNHHNPLFIVPLGNSALLNSKQISQAIELDWWQEHRLTNDANVMFVPAQHWSGRTLMDTCQSLWGSFVINANELKIFFAGDTGYSEHFKMIQNRVGPMDVSILPIGSYAPRWFMKPQHVNPEEAVLAHLDLGSKLSIGMHFGTFQLTDEGIDEPVIFLQDALKKHQVDSHAFLAPNNGKTIYFKRE